MHICRKDTKKGPPVSTDKPEGDDFRVVEVTDIGQYLFYL